MHDEHIGIAGPVTGTIAGVAGIVASVLPALEADLRLVALCFSIVASAVTVWKVVRKRRSDRRKTRRDRHSDIEDDEPKI